MQDQPTRPHDPVDVDYHGLPTDPGLPPVAPAPAQPFAQSELPPQPRRPRRARRGGFWGCLQTVVAVGLMILTILIGVTLIGALILYESLSDELAADLEKLESLEGVEDFETSRIYSRDGQLLYEVFEEGRRTEVPLSRISQYLVNATIATEDDTFYENPGFDPQSILRAVYQWYSEGEIVSGGSTITQQLVRQIVFSYEERLERTLRRKLKEAALAYVMTRQFGKDEILELYLNEVYYGNLAYGIEGAADVYFDKSAADLTLGEAAFLAGLVQSPASYDPYTNFAVAKARQSEVLGLMVSHGYISRAQADEAFNSSPLTVNDLASPDVSLEAPHFTVEVRRELGELGLDPTLIQRGGLNIYTTIDLDMQNLAQDLARIHVDAVRDEANLHNAALVALNPTTGEVLAMLGSLDYDDESIDGNVNVILSPQQPGSAMKPLTYALALEKGWTAADIIWDVPYAFDSGIGEEYIPANYDGRFHGPVRLRDALANSFNVPAVVLLRDIGGAPELLAFANRLGAESLGTDASLYGLSLTLGGGELTPLELTVAYGVFANGGYKIEPHLINRVEDLDGNVLYAAANRPGQRVLDERVAFIISSILSDNRARTPMMGQQSPLLLDFPAAVKTGTTNDYRDNWTVGYTPHLVVGVWAGNTDNSPMAQGTSGLTGAAPLWHDYMTAVYEQGLAERLTRPGLVPLRGDFPVPAGLEQHPVCYIMALRDPLRTEDGCKEHRNEWFIVRDPSQVTDTPAPTAAPPTNEAGEPLPPTRLEIEPGLWMVAVIALTEENRSPVYDTLIKGWEALPEGSPRPAPPIYCEVPPAYGDREGIVRQLFVKAPALPVDAIRARNWAIDNQRPIDPGVLCPPELIDQTLGQGSPGFDPATGATYRIDSPQPDEQVYGVYPIMGTATFDPLRVSYYKMEISGGDLPGWVTFGETHLLPVLDGILEYLHADALAPGNYVIRLVLVASDGNFIQPTFDVPIQVVPAPPEATAAP